ncbi:MAG: hypothetical protein H0X25_00795 [Acidobacteriales bacterium]|nr:hypothetical protein [Terriglobales bacterium]
MSAQTFTVLHSFNVDDGAQPLSGLVQGLDGNLYGTTSEDLLGRTYHGTLFKITTGGTVTNLHKFNGLGDGGVLFAGLTLTPDGSFYGVTNGGGPDAAGTIFKYSGGKVTTLYLFDRDTADFPFGGLFLAADGNLYGTTTDSGDKASSVGTVFRITQGGVFTILYKFAEKGADGDYPEGQLVQNGDGSLYGTTNQGGAQGDGTIFKINQAGDLTTLYSFCSVGTQCLDGAAPQAGLILGNDGAFYGTTYSGGDNSCQPADSCGTLFKYSQSGLTTLHVFQPGEGAQPTAPLYQGTDGNFYGAAVIGGKVWDPSCTEGCGTLFSLTPSDNLTVLHTFCETAGCPDGQNPYGPVVQATDGNFYGTAEQGGSSGDGIVYKLSLGLPPFVKLLPEFGVTGQSVRILGNNLLGTTGVTFNGTPAEFAVNTNSFLTATVPAGATSGTVQVTTANRVLTSNVTFHVSR